MTMKSVRTRSVLVGAMFLGLVADGWAAPPEEPSPDSNFEPMIVSQLAVPAFPVHLRRQGVTRGEVRVLLRVDSTGRLFDKLVVAYTHREFADAVLAAVPQWNFEPALQEGDPVASADGFTVVFDAQHPARVQHVERTELVTTTPDLAFCACPVNELDRPPEAQTSSAPLPVRDENGAPLAGRVQVDYFIDENGRVRMPVVVSASHPRLAWAAAAAIEQWRYESPRRHGQRVLARSSHVFEFGASTAATAPPPAGSR